MSFDGCIHLFHCTVSILNVFIIPEEFCCAPFSCQSVCHVLGPRNHWSHYRLVLSILQFYINGLLQYVLFCVWLLSLSILPLRLICIICISASFLLCSFWWLYDNLCICLLKNEQSLCEHTFLPLLLGNAQKWNFLVVWCMLNCTRNCQMDFPSGW